jgi:hypothetical protein
LNWSDQVLDDLARQPAIGYTAGSAPAAEPTALAALALAQHGRHDAARKAAEALAKLQQTSGEVGVRADETPGWPTSLAVIAWCAVDRNSFRGRTDRAVTWLLANRGKAVEQTATFGHNTELVGWAYAEQTHTWVEPTAFAVLALKAAGKADDPATREGVLVLIDRQLPGGGLNYGNTYVLGQLLRSHQQPTGITLLALVGEIDTTGRLAKSVAWLRRSIGPETTPLSLGWSLLGLRAHGIELPQADEWLAVAAGKVRHRDRSPHKLALLALAAKGWPT